MQHWSRWGVVVAVAFGSSSMACSGDDPEAAGPPDPEASEPGSAIDESGAAVDETPTQPTPVDPEWGLAFSIKGRATPMTARAELRVVEGQSDVQVRITSHATDSDLLSISLTFDGLENTIGVHREEFGTPDEAAHIAVGSIDDQWYYSLGGTIEVSVDSEGDIQGNFDVSLALTELTPEGEPVYSGAEEALSLGGEFSGAWVLKCQSHLPGHRSLSFGGEFCDNLPL